MTIIHYLHCPVCLSLLLRLGLLHVSNAFPDPSLVDLQRYLLDAGSWICRFGQYQVILVRLDAPLLLRLVPRTHVLLLDFEIHHHRLTRTDLYGLESCELALSLLVSVRFLNMRQARSITLTFWFGSSSSRSAPAARLTYTCTTYFPLRLPVFLTWTLIGTALVSRVKVRGPSCLLAAKLASNVV